MTEVSFTHIGGPTVLVEFGGWRILTDPTFDPPGRRYAFGWGTASTKTSGPAVAVSELGPVDAVLLTHDHHGDNLDDRGRALLSTLPVVVTTASGAQRLGGASRGLSAWETTTLVADGRPTIDIVATPCRHGPPLSRRIVGDVVGFSLTSDALPDGALWITGDTVLYDGLRGVTDRISVDVMLLHLGGVRFPVTGPLRYTMTVDDGIELCRLVAPRVAIPVHYEGWSHFRQGRAAIEEAVKRLADDDRVPLAFLPLGASATLESLLASSGLS